ncbi:MAG TPA: TlpA disulfide reductase family protein [Micromonosporaceae bacterium]|nr:TlpA disulfide reductase family protein [Micromonosporaceae bacterium]
MDELLLFSLSALWVVVFVNLALTFRLVRWVVGQKEMRLRFLGGGPGLTEGAPAPAFRARTLAGRPVSLDDYAGQRVVLVFSSPFCDRCRREMPTLLALARQAKAHADTTIVVVSDADITTTEVWLATMRAEDGVSVDLPILVAPTTESTFTIDYNPLSAIPFFCLIDPAGTVAARGLVGKEEWAQLVRTWEGRTQLAPWMAHQH